MLFIRALDEWILDRKIQPFAWRMEFYFGMNQFACARMVLMVMFLCTMLFKSQEWTLLMLIGAGMLMWTTFRFEEDVCSRRGLRNKLRIEFFALRVCFLLLIFLVFCIGLVSILGFVKKDLFPPLVTTGALLYCYFIACDNMPYQWKDAKDRKAKKARVASGKGNNAALEKRRYFWLFPFF